MGYESRIYITTEPFRTFPSDGYVRVFGMVDCAKSFGYMDGAMDVLKQREGIYIYADDGDTQITHDRYGDPLTYARLDEFVAGVRASSDFEPDTFVDGRLKVIEAFASMPSSFPVSHIIHFGY